MKRLVLAIALLTSFPIAAHAQSVGNGSFSATIGEGSNPAGAMGTGGSMNSIGAIGLGGNPNGAVGRGLTSVPLRSHVWIGMSGDNFPGFTSIWGTSWAGFQQNVDIVQIGTSIYSQRAKGVGLGVQGYIDPNLVSGISYAVGPNPVAAPDGSGPTYASFYHDGSNNILTTSNNNTIQARIGDPTQLTLQALAASAAVLQTDNTSIQVDDATEENPASFSWPLCWGLPTGWSPPGAFSCSTAPGGAASSVNLTSWPTGEATLAAGLPVPTMFNGNGPEVLTAIAAMSASKVWGEILEEQFYRDDNAFLTGGANMVQYVTDGLWLVNHGFNFLVMGGENARGQQGARDRIKSKLAKRGFVFDSETITLPPSVIRPVAGGQPALWATLGAQNLKLEEDLHVGWIRGDDIWHHIAEARAVFDALQKLTGRTGKLVAPLEWSRKKDVLEELHTAGLLPFTWTCEHTPSATATRGCGTCRPCRTHALAQYELKTWPSKVIPDA